VTGPGSYAPARDPDMPHASRAAPTAESIFWRPLDGEATGPGSREYPIYIRQRALAALHDHFRGAAQQGILGFLVGALLEDPTTKERWLEIEFIVRLTQAIYGDKTTLVISRVWERLQQEVGRTGGHMLGWYHSHPPLGVEIAPGDIEAHEQYFGRPWQVALVLGLGPKGPIGAVYRPSAGLPLGTTPLPFFEIVARDSVTPEGRRRTRVAWRNYKPDLKRTSGAITGVSAVLQALHAQPHGRPTAPPRPVPEPAAALVTRVNTPPRGSVAIRLSGATPRPATAATAPRDLSRGFDRPSSELPVPPTLLRSALARIPEDSGARAPASMPVPGAATDAHAAAPPAPPAPPAPAAAAAPPAPAEPVAPAAAAAPPTPTTPSAAAPSPASPPVPLPESPSPAAPTGAVAAPSAPVPVPVAPPVSAPPREESAPAAGAGQASRDSGESPMPRVLRPRARPTGEVLKELADVISAPSRSPVPVSEPEAPTASPPREPARVTFTPAPLPPEATPVPAAAEEVGAESTDSGASVEDVERLPPPLRGARVSAPAESESLPAVLRATGAPAPPRDTDPDAETVRLRPSAEVRAPARPSRRSFASGLPTAVEEERPAVRLPFVAALAAVLAIGGWWVFLRPSTVAAPVNATAQDAAAPGEVPAVSPTVVDSASAADSVGIAAADSAPDTLVVPAVTVPPQIAVPDTMPSEVLVPANPTAMFDAMFDSLTAAIVEYQTRALRFDQGERDCAALATQLITVDRLWITYNAERRLLAVPLDSSRRELDQGIYANVDSVDGHFSQSGCPRP